MNYTAVNQLLLLVRVMPYENALDNDLNDKVKLLLSVHDQQVSYARRLRCTVGNHTTELMEKLLCMLCVPAESPKQNQTSWTTGPGIINNPKLISNDHY
jgi:hypothetical protein